MTYSPSKVERIRALMADHPAMGLAEAKRQIERKDDIMARVKPLVWEKPGPNHRGAGHFEVAHTPLGDYKAWSDGELWVPNHAVHSQHGTQEGAKEAAQQHLREAIAELVH